MDVKMANVESVRWTALTNRLHTNGYHMNPNALFMWLTVRQVYKRF